MCVCVRPSPHARTQARLPPFAHHPTHLRQAADGSQQGGQPEVCHPVSQVPKRLLLHLKPQQHVGVRSVHSVH